MRQPRTLGFIVGLMAALPAQGVWVGRPGVPDYCPLIYTNDGANTNTRRFVAFFHGHKVDVPLPFELGAFANSADGALYALAGAPPLSAVKPPKGILRVELNPLRLTPITGTESFSAWSLAVSADQKTFVFAGRLLDSPERRCSVFEFSLSGRPRRILDWGDCEYRKTWLHLSLSRDGRWALASRNRRLEMIDLVQGSARPLAEGLITGAWSPDGKWIAAVREDERTTDLLDAGTLKPQRSLDTRDDEPMWSPDSRYLLVRNGCGLYGATLVMVDIQDGKRSTVSGSRCEVYGPIAGWVESNILPN